MFYVYTLFSKKDSQLYTGYTENLQSRYQAHINGFVRSTKNRQPLILIGYEAFILESDARRREKYLKGGNGRNEVKKKFWDVLEKLKYKYLNSG